MRFLLMLAGALALSGGAAPDTRIAVTLPPTAAADATGRLLVFAEPLSPRNLSAGAVDIGGPGVSVAGRDVAGFGSTRRVLVETGLMTTQQGVHALAPGDYRVQVVLDRDRSYNRLGRGPGDLVSRVTTLHFPLLSMPVIALDHALPPEAGQFDTAGLPPRAAEQIIASRPHLHDERIASPSLTRFHGTAQSVAAWVLTPPGYDPKAQRTYPTVFEAGGYGATHRLDGQQLSRQWHMMETGEIPPMIWVALDFGTATGTTEFADSASNGPWGKALVSEVIPALEARYRMDAKPSGRFLTGHSSGGWFALWAQVRYPALFGGAWATAPDPVDFHSLLGADIYAPHANLYRDASGAARPYERDAGGVVQTIEQAARMEQVLGGDGGQLHSLEWVFSPRRAEDAPAPLFDRTTGAVDPIIAAYWRDHYDIAHRIEGSGPRLRHDLDGKVHIAVGMADSFYLDGAVRRLEAAFRRVGVHAIFDYVPGATHRMTDLYTVAGDRDARWKAMTSQMLAMARPQQDRCDQIRQSRVPRRGDGGAATGQSPA